MRHIHNLLSPASSEQLEATAIRGNAPAYRSTVCDASQYTHDTWWSSRDMQQDAAKPEALRLNCRTKHSYCHTRTAASRSLASSQNKGGSAALYAAPPSPGPEVAHNVSISAAEQTCSTTFIHAGRQLSKPRLPAKSPTEAQRGMHQQQQVRCCHIVIRSQQPSHLPIQTKASAFLLHPRAHHRAASTPAGRHVHHPPPTLVQQRLGQLCEAHEVRQQVSQIKCLGAHSICAL